jgi:hypothetical protein
MADEQHQFGSDRTFVDPMTGDVIVERPILLPGTVAKRDANGGPATSPFAIINMDALWQLQPALGNAAGLIILLEAARQNRMNGGSIKLTTGFQNKRGLSRRQVRTAVKDLAALAEDTGWLKVNRDGQQAAVVEITDLGMRKIWHST